MPVYEYRCTGCKARFSLIGSMAECSEPRECPDCGSVSPRVMSQFNMRMAKPFRIMQEEKDSPGHYRQRAFAPDCDTPPPGTSREYWDEVDTEGDVKIREKVEKEAAEVALGNREPPKSRHPLPRMFPKGAPIRGLDYLGGNKSSEVEYAKSQNGRT